MEDLLQEGYIALHEAVEQYQEVGECHSSVMQLLYTSAYARLCDE